MRRLRQQLLNDRQMAVGAGVLASSSKRLICLSRFMSSCEALAFEERRKMHDLLMEGLDMVFRQRGLRSINDLTGRQ